METLLTPQETAEYLKLTTRCLEDRRRTGRSPPWVALSHRCVRYRPSDLQAWVEDHLQDAASTQDNGKRQPGVGSAVRGV